jgi:prevent-host-death family protein
VAGRLRFERPTTGFHAVERIGEGAAAPRPGRFGVHRRDPPAEPGRAHDEPREVVSQMTTPPAGLDQHSGQGYSEGMEPVSVYDAKTHLSRLLDAVEAGEEVVITRNGQPVARLVRALPTPRRRFGTLPGVAQIREDFDAPLSIDDLDFVSR